MLSWSQRPDLGVVCAAPFEMKQIELDPLEIKLVEPFLKASVFILRTRQSWPGEKMNLPTIVLDGLGNDLETGLVAMECMACGVPTILSANTGHLDLIQDQNCFPLLRQNPISGAAHADWGESDVDEIVATLEFAYADRSNAALRGARGSAFMSRFTWSRQLEQFA